MEAIFDVGRRHAGSKVVPPILEEEGILHRRIDGAHGSAGAVAEKRSERPAAHSLVEPTAVRQECLPTAEGKLVRDVPGQQLQLGYGIFCDAD